MGRNKSPRVDYWRLKQNPQLQKRLAKRYPRTVRRKAEREAKAAEKRLKKIEREIQKYVEKDADLDWKLEKRYQRELARRNKIAVDYLKLNPKPTSHNTDYYLDKASGLRNEYLLKQKAIDYYTPYGKVLATNIPEKQLAKTRRLYNSYSAMDPDRAEKLGDDPWQAYLKRMEYTEKYFSNDPTMGLPYKRSFVPKEIDTRRFERFDPTYGSELYNTAGEFYLDKYGQMHRKGEMKDVIDWNELRKGRTSSYWITKDIDVKKLEKEVEDAEALEEFQDEAVAFTEDEAEKQYQKQVKEQEAIDKFLEKQAEKDIAKWEKEHPATTDADRLNDMFEYASDKFGNRDDYQKYLAPMLGQLMGDDFYQKLLQDPKSLIGDYQYFTIDESYRADNKDNLFKHIHFKDLPDGFEDYVEQIADLDWSSPENYAMHRADVQRDVYTSNLKTLYNNGKDDDDVNYDFMNDTYFIVLESVMQSSAAWDIAKRSAFDSDQRQSNWFDLYMTGSLAYDHKDTDPHIWDEFRQMVDNHEALFYIEDRIDELLIEAAKKG
jgi:hypothetical protein